MFTWMHEIGFDDRRTAGRLLAEKLAQYHSEAPIVVGLSPGGMIVAAEIADALGADLDVIVAGDVPAPTAGDDDLGAVTLSGVAFFEPWRVHFHRLTISDLYHLATPAITEARRRTRRLRGRAALPAAQGRIAILGDDGTAPKAHMLAAVAALRDNEARQVVAAVAVAAPAVVKRLREDVDAAFCLLEPDPIGSATFWFRTLEPAGDPEIVGLLAARNGRNSNTRRPIKKHRPLFNMVNT